MRPGCGLFDFYLSLGLVRVCEIEISRMGKNNGYPNLVCQKSVDSDEHVQPPVKLRNSK